MAATLSLTVDYRSVEDGWIEARIRELPAVITAAPTQAQATDHVVDALREYLLALGPAAQGQSEPGPGRLAVTIEPV